MVLMKYFIKLAPQGDLRVIGEFNTGVNIRNVGVPSRWYLNRISSLESAQEVSMVLMKYFIKLAPQGDLRVIGEFNTGAFLAKECCF